MTALSTHPESRNNAWRAAFIVTMLAAAVSFGSIFANVYNERASADERGFHLVVIEQFSRQFPRPDLSDYYSATGPGYHLVLAIAHRWITSDIHVLRTGSAMFTLGLGALLAWTVGRYAKWPTAVALCLPMLASLYVYVSGVWLLPDNLAWLTVLAAVLLAFREKVDASTYLGAAFILAAAVFVRQINLWPLGVLVAGVAITQDSERWLPRFAPRWPARASMMLLAGVPAVLILAWFHHLWHGLTPPAFQTVAGPLPPGHSSWQHEGPNLAVPAMVLSVLAATGLFFALFLLPTVRDVFSKRGKLLAIVAIGMLVGAMTALVVQSDFTPAPGPRYSGLWNVSAYFPVIANRSLLITALAAIGGGVVMLWFIALNSRDRWIWLATWTCFAVAQSANAKAWHKYYEPFCLIMLALAAARVVAHGKAPRWAISGPIVLFILLAIVTCMNLTHP